MQWTGQKVMFDLRSQIFRHLQHMHVGFFDKNPVGRLVTRVTTDVDALNEMFTAGVVSIFEDVFVLTFILAIMLDMNWKLALLTFTVLPLIVYATKVFRDKVRDSYRRIRTAIARINSFLQEAVSGMLVLQLFNREKRAYNQFSDINASHMEAYKDAILAYAIYYPVVEILSSIAVASIIWFGGNGILRQHHSFDGRHRIFANHSAECAHRADGDDHRRAGRFHAICAALLPADSGSEREVQHSPKRDGGG